MSGDRAKGVAGAGRPSPLGESGRPVTTMDLVQSPLSPQLHVEVPLSKTLNPQLLIGSFIAAHYSLINKDGLNAEKNFPHRDI